MLATAIETETETIQKQLINRAADKRKLGSGFSKSMTREQMKNALVAARVKAKEFHNIL